MKILKQVLDLFVKIVSALLIILIAGIVCVMLYELILRNVFNSSFRASTELCGFLFMWMAFLGVIVLYDKDGLITLDILYAHSKPSVQTVFWFINKVFSIGLGVIMVVAYAGMYKVNSTSYFSTMQFLSKAWHFLPMAIAGTFIAIKSVHQIYEKIVMLGSTGKEKK